MSDPWAIASNTSAASPRNISINSRSISRSWMTTAGVDSILIGAAATGATATGAAVIGAAATGTTATAAVATAAAANMTVATGATESSGTG